MGNRCGLNAWHTHTTKDSFNASIITVAGSASVFFRTVRSQKGQPVFNKCCSPKVYVWETFRGLSQQFQREVPLFCWYFVLKHCRIGRKMPPCQKPAWSVQLFWQNADLWQTDTDRQTDRQTPSHTCTCTSIALHGEKLIKCQQHQQAFSAVTFALK